MLHDHKGNVLDVGRRHRRPPPALRRAVRERDQYRCQAPGCQSRRTDIHHIRPWAKGGKTRLRDLILLCEADHMIVHASGYIITLADDGTFIFTKPDGTIIPNCPRLPEADGDFSSQHAADITADSIIPAGLADKFDLDLTIWASFANARLAEERPGTRAGASRVSLCLPAAGQLAAVPGLDDAVRDRHRRAAFGRGTEAEHQTLRHCALAAAALLLL